MERLEIENSEEENEIEDDHDEPVGCSMEGIVTFSVGLVAGTFSALICKAAYDTSSYGLDGVEKPFAKPIVMLLLMFCSMSPSMLFWFIQQRFLIKPEDRDVVPMKTLMILIIPCICDLMCTLLLLVAQLYITASMWQMLRGSVIIITAVLKCNVLNIQLKRHMWIGVFVITIAMLLVASTSFLNPATSGTNPEEDPADAKDPRVGVLLVVIGCLAQGVQYVFEEKVMAVGAPPLVVIGAEGLWGTFLTLTVIYPLAYYVVPGSDCGGTCYEDPWDSLAMVQDSPLLTKLVIGFVFFVTIYNCMVIYVTKYLSSIWHAILDNFRPISIWGLDLAIFYVFAPGQGFGEQWLGFASWVQLCGLMVLFLGTAIYNGSLGVFGEEATGNRAYQTIPSEDGAPARKTAMDSPSLSHSPLIYRREHRSNSRSNSVSSPGGLRKRGGSTDRSHNNV